jgi:glycosyltransferase involved in cell wall biosynthesis
MAGHYAERYGRYICKTMKVLYYAHSVLNRGGDRVVLAHLAHLAASGHEVTIQTNVFDTCFAIHPGIAIKKLKLPSACGTIFSAILSKQSADCLIATIIPVAFFLYLRNPKKVVYLAQEFEALGYSHRLKKLFVRFLSYVGLKVLGIPTIAVSSRLGQFLRDHYRANVEIVPNGVDTGVFYPDPAQEYLSLKEGGRAILLYARNDARKGFDIALKVVGRLKREENSTFDVWLIGENVAMDEIGFTHRHFGFLHDVQLRRVLSSADLFLYPSRTDGCGLIVAEAFACKCPVVTTAAVPLAEDGVNALVSDTGCVEDLTHKVTRLLADKEMGDQLAERGYDFVRGMALNAATARFESVLMEMRRRQ